MKQDDYFLKQIDILGRILGKIVSDLLKLKNKGEIMESIEITTQALKNELDLNLNEILLLPFVIFKLRSYFYFYSLINIFLWIIK